MPIHLLVNLVWKSLRSTWKLQCIVMEGEAWNLLGVILQMSGVFSCNWSMLGVQQKSLFMNSCTFQDLDLTPQHHLKTYQWEPFYPQFHLNFISYLKCHCVNYDLYFLHLLNPLIWRQVMLSWMIIFLTIGSSLLLWQCWCKHLLSRSFQYQFCICHRSIVLSLIVN